MNLDRAHWLNNCPPTHYAGIWFLYSLLVPVK